jgi:hypothetical protein
MTRAAARFGLAALVAAWAVDQLFWQKTPGISLPLWIALTLAIGIFLARSVKVRPSPASLALMAITLAFAVMTFLRREGFTVFISTTLAFFGLALLAATFRTGNWLSYKIADYVKAGFQLLAALMIRPMDLFMRKPQAAPLAEPDAIVPEDSAGSTAAPVLVAAGPGWKTARQQAMPVVRGLLLALPIVLVLGGLLASADPVFNNWTRGLTSIFNLDKLGEYLLRLIYILIIAYVLAGVYLHAIQPTTLEARPDPQARWFKPFLGWTEAMVVLAAVNLLFLVFVGIQFWYLFGGQANISTTGFTYSEYARRGFNELVMVALLSLLLYLGLGSIARQETAWQHRALTILNVLLMAQVLVILVSSLSRLLLYEDAYGFTQLRTYTHIFIVWLGILLVLTAGLEIARRRFHFGLAALLVTFGFGLTLGVINVDSFIAQQNIQRAQVTGKLDGQYLTTLSDDAVPTLVEEYQRANQPAAVKDILGAELACRTEHIDVAAELGSSWLSYNLSQATAINLLRSNQALWKIYSPADQVMPDGTFRDCRMTTIVD